MMRMTLRIGAKMKTGGRARMRIWSGTKIMTMMIAKMMAEMTTMMVTIMMTRFMKHWTMILSPPGDSAIIPVITVREAIL